MGPKTLHMMGATSALQHGKLDWMGRTDESHGMEEDRGGPSPQFEQVGSDKSVAPRTSPFWRLRRLCQIR